MFSGSFTEIANPSQILGRPPDRQSSWQSSQSAFGAVSHQNQAVYSVFTVSATTRKLPPVNSCQKRQS